MALGENEFDTPTLKNSEPRILEGGDAGGSYIRMSKAERMGQVQKVTGPESPGCLAVGKTGKTSIVRWDFAPWVAFPPLAYHWSRGSEFPLTFPSLACC